MSFRFMLLINVTSGYLGGLYWLQKKKDALAKTDGPRWTTLESGFSPPIPAICQNDLRDVKVTSPGVSRGEDGYYSVSPLFGSVRA